MIRIFVTLILSCSLLIAHSQSDIIDNETFNKALEHYNQAVLDFDSEDFKSAIANFRKAHNLNSGNSDYPFGLASSFYEINAYDSAKKYIEIAIQLAPDQPDYHYKAGGIYFKSKDYQKAVHNYNMTLSNLNDEYFIDLQDCYFNKAVSEFYLEEYSSAISDLTLLINEDSEEYNYIHLRGVSYLKIKKLAEACSDLEKADALGNPNSGQYLAKYCN